MLLAWQDSSELRQLLSQLSCAGERSGRGETLPAGAEEGSRCVIPFCSFDGRDHRANAGHKVSSEKPHAPKDNRSSYSCLAKHFGSWRPAVAEPVHAVLCCTGGQRHNAVSRLLHKDTAPDRGARAAERTPRTQHSSHCMNVRNAWKIAQSTEQPVGNSLSQ